MSRSIQLLSDEIARQIAAGEVVERPASVVKELCENALDAGATLVTLESRDGGKTYLRVSDNGSGIAREDIPLAFLRHATSKIATIEDLLSISTMGFRGEALYSIAAVSRMTLITKRPEDELGSRVVNEGGELGSIVDTGCPDGTTFVVEDLFFNTPARLKFMKSHQAETAAINTVVTGLVLSHPDVSFEWIHNGKVMVHSAGDGSLKNAVYALYGKEVANYCIPMDARVDDIRILGLLGRPEVVRSNRNQEHLFVNGRMIQSPLCARAVERGYGSLLMVQKFPFFVLNLEMNPERVDVNVHPNKLQVRFRDEQQLFGIIMNQVAAALREFTRSPRDFRLEETTPARKSPEASPSILERWNIPKMEAEPAHEKVQETVKAAPVDPVKPVVQETSHVQREAPKTEVSEKRTVVTPSAPKAPPQTVSSMLAEYRKSVLQAAPAASNRDFHRMFDAVPSPSLHQEASIPLVTEQVEMEKPPQQYRLVGTAFDTYLILEEGDKLYLVDQHAAHERLLFDRFMEAYRKNAVISQTLLIPCQLDLTVEERLTLEEQGDTLRAMGFAFEEYGPSVYRVNAVPQILGQSQPMGLLRELIAILRQPEYQQRKSSVEEQLLYTACRKAIKGGDRLSEAEIRELLAILHQEDVPLNCPHGRPICMELTRDRIEKQFKRIQ